MIVLITGIFKTYDRFGIQNGEKFMVSHGINTKDDSVVILPNEHPAQVGGVYNSDIGDWVIYPEKRK